MRISFDVDDTLVCDPSVPTEQLVRWWSRWWYPEPLRRGTKALMQELLTGGHELWLYTTSYRPARYLRGWLRSFGVPIYGVVNQHRHESVVGRQGPSKYRRRSVSTSTSMTPKESVRKASDIGLL